MTMNFLGLTAQPGGEGGKRSSNYTAGPGGPAAELQGGVETGSSAQTRPCECTGVVREVSCCLKEQASNSKSYEQG